MTTWVLGFFSLTVAVALAAARRRRGQVNLSPPETICTFLATLSRNRPRHANAALRAATEILN
jgi:hypothetical protein